MGRKRLHSLVVTETTFLHGDAGKDNLDGGGGFDVVDGGEGEDAIIREKVDGNTLPLLPSLADIDVPRVNDGFAVPLPAVDADGDGVIYSTVSSDSDVVVTVRTDGLWIETSDDFIGSAEITVTANDGRGLSDTRSFSVVARNQLPVITGVEDVSRLQNTGSFYVPFMVTDIDGDVIARTVTSSDSRISLLVVKKSTGDYELKVTPNSAFTGRDDHDDCRRWNWPDSFDGVYRPASASTAMISLNATTAQGEYCCSARQFRQPLSLVQPRSRG